MSKRRALILPGEKSELYSEISEVIEYTIVNSESDYVDF